MPKLIIHAAVAAAAISAIAMSAQAAPLSGLAGDTKANAGQATAVEKAAYRRCWWRYGVRHCRYYYGYYDNYGPAYGYGPDIGLFFGGGGGGGGHFHGGGHGGGHHR